MNFIHNMAALTVVVYIMGMSTCVNLDCCLDFFYGRLNILSPSL